jgi:hypothetical protein
MSDEQIAELVEAARHDGPLWRALKDREINQFHEDGSPKMPSLAMLVSDLVKKRYGPDHIYSNAPLILRLRYHTRQELGLPI